MTNSVSLSFFILQMGMIILLHKYYVSSPFMVMIKLDNVGKAFSSIPSTLFACKYLQKKGTEQESKNVTESKRNYRGQITKRGI